MQHSQLFYSLASGKFRVAWRLVIFLALLALPFWFIQVEFGSRPLEFLFSPRGLIIVKGLIFLSVALATYVMARIERQPWSHYGLPLRRAFSRKFWQGMAFGFAAFSALIVLMLITGAVGFSGALLHGST